MPTARSRSRISSGARRPRRHDRTRAASTIDHGFAERTTFIVTQDGKVAATIGGVSPEENVAQALQAVKDIAAL